MDARTAATAGEPAADAAGACCPAPRRLRPRATAGFAAFFKALADPTRLEVVGLLAARRGELCACELESHFDLSQPTVSHHLRVLREAGIVTPERRGTWVYYSLREDLRGRLRGFDELIGP